MGLDDYTTTSDNYQVEQSLIRQVLEVIASQKATYLGEIDNQVMQDRDDIKRTLYHLKEAKVIELIPVRYKNLDPRLVSRITDMWQRGITGSDRFKQMRWYGLNTAHNWKLKVSGYDFYVDEFHKKIDSEGYDKGAVRFASNRVNG
jgi:hypothetical protein